MARDAIDIKETLGALVIALALVLLAAAPAWAQRDRMQMGEQLGAQIFRAQPTSTLPGVSVATPAEPPRTTASPPSASDAVKLQESITTDITTEKK